MVVRSEGEVTRSERRKAGTVAAILGAAERAFLRSGYAGTRVEDIAADADVAVGSIYVHFNNKLGLYLALLEEAVDAEERYLAPAFDPSRSPLERLIAAGDAYVDFYRDFPGYFRILALPHLDASADAAEPVTTARLAKLAGRQISRLIDTVTEGVESGELVDVDPRSAAMFLWGSWLGVLTLHLRPVPPRVGDEELARVLETGRAMLLDGTRTIASGRKRAPARRNNQHGAGRERPRVKD